MKTLLVMRHAKSSWKHSELPDFERPLNKRGKRDAPEMGHLLRDRELLPQYIVASTAQRVRETVELFEEACGFSGQVGWDEKLYLADPEVILRVLAAVPDEFERVMVVAHNPGLEMIVQLLSNRIESLSTGAVACFALRIEHWSELNEKLQGDLIEFWKPGDLMESVEEDEMAKKEKEEKKLKDEKKQKKEKKENKQKKEKKEKKEKRK
jgi:phosphohistidine phosphatase